MTHIFCIKKCAQSPQYPIWRNKVILSEAEDAPDVIKEVLGFYGIVCPRIRVSRLNSHRFSSTKAYWFLSLIPFCKGLEKIKCLTFPTSWHLLFASKTDSVWDPQVFAKSCKEEILAPKRTFSPSTLKKIFLTIQGRLSTPSWYDIMRCKTWAHLIFT